MKLYYPPYYYAFRCLASACPDSCCKEWTVDVDDVSAARYRALAGALGDRLRGVLQDTEEGTIIEIEEGRCPMWRQDGLCRIQAELGHDALCKTCREFPRLRHDYGNFVELGLELSCPESARLIFSGDSLVIEEEIPGQETPEYDMELMEILKASRKRALVWLEDKRFSLPQRLAVLLLYSYDIQSQIDGGDADVFAPEALLAEAKKLATQGDIDGFLSFFRNLEILTPQWGSRLSSPAKTLSWTESLTHLAVYMVQRYWLQAVGDLDLVCRVKFAVVACILVAALGNDPVSTSQLFSKEIENDPDNVEAILQGAYTSPSLTDVNLLSLLLQ